MSGNFLGKFITNTEQLYFNSYLSVSLVRFEKRCFELDLFRKYGVNIDYKLTRSVDKRKAEYLAGRICAQKAIEHLVGASSEPPVIPVGINREPIWPTNLVGSIAHTNKFAICAVGKRQDFKYLGFDIEEILSKEQTCELAKLIHSDQEQQLLVKSGMSEQHATTVLFSAKESIFKGLYYQVRTYFGFEVARLVEVDASHKRLKFELDTRFSLKHDLPKEVTCQFIHYDEFVLTNMIIDF